jgi:hypothetical protein
MVITTIKDVAKAWIARASFWSNTGRVGLYFEGLGLVLGTATLANSSSNKKTNNLPHFNVFGILREGISDAASRHLEK